MAISQRAAKRINEADKSGRKIPLPIEYITKEITRQQAVDAGILKHGELTDVNKDEKITVFCRYHHSPNTTVENWRVYNYRANDRALVEQGHQTRSHMMCETPKPTPLFQLPTGMLHSKIQDTIPERLQFAPPAGMNKEVANRNVLCRKIQILVHRIAQGFFFGKPISLSSIDGELFNQANHLCEQLLGTGQTLSEEREVYQL